MNPIRVLLAEDHNVVREGLRLLLNAQPDIRVIGEATNGRQAVALARESCPDVAVLDISMPDLDGLQAGQPDPRRVSPDAGVDPDDARERRVSSFARSRPARPAISSRRPPARS